MQNEIDRISAVFTREIVARMAEVDRVFIRSAFVAPSIEFADAMSRTGGGFAAEIDSKMTEAYLSVSSSTQLIQALKTARQQAAHSHARVFGNPFNAGQVFKSYRERDEREVEERISSYMDNEFGRGFLVVERPATFFLGHLSSLLDISEGYIPETIQHDSTQPEADSESFMVVEDPSIIFALGDYMMPELMLDSR